MSRLTEKNKTYMTNQLTKLRVLEDIEEELGLPLKIWIYLVQKYFINEERIYVENSIDDETEKHFLTQLNDRPQRFILEIDFEEKFIRLQGMEDWCKMPFKDYGKTWALTKEELL